MACLLIDGCGVAADADAAAADVAADIADVVAILMEQHQQQQQQQNLPQVTSSHGKYAIL